MKCRLVAPMVVAGFVTVALVSCSVPITGVTGILRTGDRLTALVSMCEGVTSDSLELTPTRGLFFLLPRPTWDFEAARVASVELGSLEEFLSLMGDEKMDLDSSSSSGAGGLVRFTRDDINRLADGAILAEAGARPLYVTSYNELEFAKYVRDTCGA